MLNIQSVELAVIRNELYRSHFTDEHKQGLFNIIKKIEEKNNPYRFIIKLCINNALYDISKNNFKKAAEEINIIHNFPLYDKFGSWDQKYFFNMELLGYIENIKDEDRVKSLIKEVAYVI